jgi:hypothetical protein
VEKLPKKDINQVHKFFSCKVVSDKECPKCHKKQCGAYDYAGGMTNGYNKALDDVKKLLTSLTSE